MYIYYYSANRLIRVIGRLNRLNAKRRVADRLASRITLAFFIIRTITTSFRG
jgi:hypothetical protein